VRLAEEERRVTMAQDFKSSGAERPPVDAASVSGSFPLKNSQARRSRPGFFHSLMILIARQWSILAADKLNVLFLLAQPVLIGHAVGLGGETTCCDVSVRCCHSVVRMQQTARSRSQGAADLFVATNLRPLD